MHKIEIDKKTLKQLYCIEGKKQSEIAKQFNCSVACISIKLKEYNLRHKTEDSYIGQPFGFLTPISVYGYDNNSHIIFNCVCICGNIVQIKGYSLKTDNTQTCGCQSRKCGKNHPLYRGYEEINHVFWLSILRGAKERNLEVTVSIEDVWQLFLKQNRKCALTGIPLIFGKTRKSWKTTTASLDRIDNDKGYLLDNIQWIHKDLNIMKRHHSQNEFINWCKLVAKYN